MPVPQQTCEGTVPFVSCLVGALLAAELVKIRHFPQYALLNELRLNVFRPHGTQPSKTPMLQDCPHCGTMPRS